MDTSAIYFEIPARDALGHLHVTGKLLAAETSLQLFWKLKDRTFRRAAEEMQLIDIGYGNLESVRFTAVLYWFKPRLILRLTDPLPLQGLPGAEVGTVTLEMTGSGARTSAERFIKLVDYRKSDAEAARGISRLSDLERPSSL